MLVVAPDCRALAYRRRQGSTTGSSLTVVVVQKIVVQKMVPADVPDVLFTADAMSGRRYRMVIEAIAGRHPEQTAWWRALSRVYAIR